MSNQARQITDINKQVEPVIQALKTGLGDDLVALVLFGSQARGEATAMSDWDVLLLARSLPEQTFPRHLYLKQMLPPPWAGKMTFVAKTVTEFESGLTELFLDIAIDGVILYDPAGYVADCLYRLRRLIQKKGLYRERMEKDLIWRWRKFPGPNWSLDWSMAK